ncbi:hypothetical protein POTOM_005565 [Populus tomentosa]|uniref:Cupin type-1 domain-containing protein n=1 Tax=Populus tomentosa TaxID=118781 RepID=A0A8X8AMQ7_POPTO|nr:hypothetical protein POTOM_005565 [Populus tomentosa]
MTKVWNLAETSPRLLFSVGLFLVVLLCFTLRLCFFSLCSSISRSGFDDWIWDDVMGGHVEGGGDEFKKTTCYLGCGRAIRSGNGLYCKNIGTSGLRASALPALKQVSSVSCNLAMSAVGKLMLAFLLLNDRENSSNGGDGVKQHDLIVALITFRYSFHGTAAIEYGIFLSGSCRMQIVFPNGTQVMNATVKAGDAFWVPRYFPFYQIAARSGSIEFFGFTTSARKNRPQLLIGASSILQTLRIPELAAAFSPPDEEEPVAKFRGAKCDQELWYRNGYGFRLGKSEVQNNVGVVSLAGKLEYLSGITFIFAFLSSFLCFVTFRV